MVLAVERHGAMDHRVQQHPQGPRVHLRAPVRPPVDDLRGGVERAAAERLQVLVAAVEVGQAEVCDLGRPGTKPGLKAGSPQRPEEFHVDRNLFASTGL